jgi:hypothetical protein
MMHRPIISSHIHEIYMGDYKLIRIIVGTIIDKWPPCHPHYHIQSSKYEYVQMFQKDYILCLKCDFIHLDFICRINVA